MRRQSAGVLGPVSRQEKEDTGGIEEGRDLQICKGLRVGKGEGILKSSQLHRAGGMVCAVWKADGRSTAEPP